MTNQEKVSHMIALNTEIEHLKTMIRPHDTGHIYTTISTLEERVKNLHKEIYNKESRSEYA